MRKFVLFILLAFPLQLIFSQTLTPYTLGFKSAEEVSIVKGTVVQKLKQNGIKVVGQYQPADDATRWVVVFSSPELESAVLKVGGLTGFASTLRLGITREGNQTFVSYTNPEYWGTAYFRDDFDKVSSNYESVNTKLEKAMRACGSFEGTSFGSEKGLEVKKLKNYRYMMGMAQFNNTIKLGTFDSHQDALDKVETSIKEGVTDVELVYRVTIPGKNLTLYGFGLSGEKGEGKFLPIIDIAEPKHTAFLPYEMLVVGNEVHMLHGRFRIALSFPDLTMGTFTKIMSTPPTIKKMLAQLVTGETL